MIYYDYICYMWLYMHVHANRKKKNRKKHMSEKVHVQQFIAAKLWLQYAAMILLVSMRLEHCSKDVGMKWMQSHLMTIIIATGIRVIDTEYNNLSSNKRFQYPESTDNFFMKKNSGVSEAICDCLRCVSRLCMKVPQRELQTTNFWLPSMPSKSTPSAQGSKTPKTLWVVQSATIFGCLWHLYLTSFTIIQHHLTSFNII